MDWIANSRTSKKIILYTMNVCGNVTKTFRALYFWFERCLPLHSQNSIALSRKLCIENVIKDNDGTIHMHSNQKLG